MGTRITIDGAERVYNAASLWVDRALRADDSIFTQGKPIWSNRWLGEARERLLGTNDTKGSFDIWLQQLEGSPPEVYQLVGEALYVFFLTPNSPQDPKAKWSQIEKVLEGSSLELDVSNDGILDTLIGLLGGGRGFSSSRPYYVGFLIEFAEQLKAQEPGERDKLLNDAWAFKGFVENIDLQSVLLRNNAGSAQAQRLALIHLVHPDTFEGIVSVTHKDSVVSTFRDLIKLPTGDVDRDLAQIRQILEPHYGQGPHFFYKPAIQRQWNSYLKDYTGRTYPENGEKAPEPPEPPAGWDVLGKELLLPADFLEEINTLLEDKKQVIFHGPPGTGKTYLARKLAKHWAKSAENVTLVQFHPSYAYEDFVQGFRPKGAEGGQVKFELQDGPLLEIAKRAEEDENGKYYLIIDEINRGNISKILGELYFLLEYREESVRLQYSPKLFSLPRNLYIIGTMNTADRSIALVDLALRRRFYFVEFHPDEWPVQDLLGRWLDDNAPDLRWVAEVVDRANRELNDRDAAVGPSYFMKEGLDETRVRRIWEHSVLPYIEERLFGENQVRSRFSLDALKKSDAPGNAPDDDDGQNNSIENASD